MRRSNRAKRYRIVVRPSGVELVVPKYGRRQTAVAFAEQKREWIQAKFHEVKKREENLRLSRERSIPLHLPAVLENGSKIPFRGGRLTLMIRGGRAPARLVEDGVVCVPALTSRSEESRQRLVRKKLLAWLDQQALEDAWRWAELYGPLLGKAPKRFLLRQQKTRWGSCSADGTIRLNRLLLGTPPRVFEYVVVHELCHLVERNHAPAFWALVEQLMPDFRQPRHWLRSVSPRADD